jgi:hypothetical protein
MNKTVLKLVTMLDSYGVRQPVTKIYSQESSVSGYDNGCIWHVSVSVDEVMKLAAGVFSATEQEHGHGALWWKNVVLDDIFTPVHLDTQTLWNVIIVPADFKVDNVISYGAFLSVHASFAYNPVCIMVADQAQVFFDMSMSYGYEENKEIRKWEVVVSMVGSGAQVRFTGSTSSTGGTGGAGGLTGLVPYCYTMKVVLAPRARCWHTVVLSNSFQYWCFVDLYDDAWYQASFLSNLEVGHTGACLMIQNSKGERAISRCTNRMVVEDHACGIVYAQSIAAAHKAKLHQNVFMIGENKSILVTLPAVAVHHASSVITHESYSGCRSNGQLDYVASRGLRAHIREMMVDTVVIDWSV